MKTLVIDIENTLIVHIEFKSKQELENLMRQENFDQDFIVCNVEKKPNCCAYGCDENPLIREQCVCDLLVF